jgi:hypothetical protein
MRKIVIALLFSGSALFASPSSNTLQGEDAQFLFGNQKANVELISQNEMEQTEAQGWFSALVVSAVYIAYVYHNPFSWADLSGAVNIAKIAYESDLP